MAIDEAKYEVLERCLDSLKGADEILVIDNWKSGYSVPINYGLSQATGDYLIVMNDDLILSSGSLDQLCDPEAVISPTIDGREQPFWGCAFCIPRWVYEKVGGLDERYRISFYDDDDYINILRQANIPMKSQPLVKMLNQAGGGRTLHQFPDHNEFFAENRERYKARWGGYPNEIDRFYELYGRLPKMT